MGGRISREQMNDYREVVKDRISEEAIGFLHTRFMKAAPSGVMTPLLFKQYIESVGMFKNRRILQEQRRWQQGSIFDKLWASRYKGERQQPAAGANGDANRDAAEEDGIDYYDHLFRGYDINNEGVITFKKFLMYHVAVVYSTEDLFYVVFNAYDDDGDGFLSLTDIKAVITAATRYVGDYDVNDREVRRVIDEEARRLMGFLDIRKQGYIQMEDMRLITQKYPQVLEKMKNLM
ncbi:conserved hypothetical protein [Leishmania infantum JPCM5]|uniref:EF-hand_domain/EF-hand_domain_pair_-_putative n=3 Tax=Leishmania donovani species complex TaxID=38574 RepID=A0A6L0XA80_LEIIN|nr:conserved hypothetical protein [Leishmania infantum JPCM5]XP_003860156.1 hypothetical protein, conserved [Leishmania donovani]CAC9481535.1 EF-hand_domain/EF-hand_domain_pair_-_putative [Leishmania infantum]AYU78072.1 EF-hand domain/EF-hand domain pair, putative [Leishmania donovani]CAM67196.1 conserved hypothetical protein [Leishmania infantum JPCM5]CBZ33449.1 hypothetical protein, conserved [Leishmania donovani]SUZ41071.1 EF-hand_domain/EF-hand_domain_pair_-_putative [Leishmania infantum]|eukprot:XP_001464955.1 conserved hypothetical protein [Leishmania infantum JPCM5]